MALTFVQAAGGNVNSNTTVTVPYGASTTSASYLIAIGTFLLTTGSATLSDTLVNTWIPIGSPLVTGGATLQIWQVPLNKAGGGANSVTLTAPATNGFNSLGIFEYTGQAASPLDTISAWTSGTGTTATSASISTNFTNETIVVLGLNSTGTASTAGSGFTLRLSGTTAQGQNIGEDQAQAAAGTYSGSWTQTASAAWQTIALGIKSTTSTGGGGVGTTNTQFGQLYQLSASLGQLQKL